MEDYRVNLDVYNGPLDLLLYLIRRDEVDVYDIPIARITEQYIRYVELLQKVDPNLAGEFLVLAAMLIEIKTRMLLPSPPPQEGGETGLAVDPRAELVRQLLEYKAFKDAAGDLAAAAELQSMKYPRRPVQPGAGEVEYDLENAQVWDLLDAFSRLMEAIGQRSRQHEVIYDDTPVELHAADIMDRLQREGPLSFERVFEGRTLRAEIIGLFLALLELVRQRRILAVQEQNFGQIEIRLNPDPPPEPIGGPNGGLTREPSPGPAPQDAETPPEAPATEGQYVSTTPPSDAPGDSEGPANEENDDGPSAANAPDGP